MLDIIFVLKWFGEGIVILALVLAGLMFLLNALGSEDLRFLGMSEDSRQKKTKVAQLNGPGFGWVRVLADGLLINFADGKSPTKLTIDLQELKKAILELEDPGLQGFALGYGTDSLLRPRKFLGVIPRPGKEVVDIYLMPSGYLMIVGKNDLLAALAIVTGKTRKSPVYPESQKV